MNSIRFGAGLLVCLCLAVGLASAEDWPNWRGPAFNGTSSEKGLPASWSTTENIAWATPMPGMSSATPVIWGDHVFVSSTEARTKSLLAMCLDAKTGKVLWRHEMGKDRPALSSNTMASPSPITDGKRVWFYYGSGLLAAFSVEGKPLWSRDLEKELGEFIVKYGYSSSPLLYKGKLFVELLQNEDPAKYHASNRDAKLPSYLMAINPLTGKDIWKVERKTDARDEAQEAYTTPIFYETEKRSEVLVHGGDYVTSHDPETGGELWRWGYDTARQPRWRLIPSLVAGDGLIYGARPRASSLFAIKAGGEGVLNDACLAWKYDGQTTDASTPLLYDGRLYVLNGEAHDLICLDAKTGQLKWRGDLKVGSVLFASPTGADGKVYCISESGDAVVVEAGDQFKVVSRTPMGEGPCRSTIAVAGGRLFIRTAKNLYCVGGK